MEQLFLPSGITVETLIKIPFLVVLFLYSLFALILFNKVRSLGRMVFISHLRITTLLDIIAFLHFAVAVSLFFISLVIL